MSYLQGKQGRYNDNFSLQRAICMQKTGTERLQGQDSKHLNQYHDINPNATAGNFRCFPQEDLHIVEQLVEVNILVYDFKVPDDGFFCRFR